NVAWSDGSPLEASHFVHSFERLLKSKGPAAGGFKSLKPSGVKAIGKHLLEITLTEPTSNFLHLLTLPATYPIRKERMEKLDNNPRDVTVAQAVLGPYLLAEWKKGSRLVLEGNPSHGKDDKAAARPAYRVELH